MAQAVHEPSPAHAVAEPVRTSQKDLGRAQAHDPVALPTQRRRTIGLPGPEDVVVDHGRGIAFISSQERTRPFKQASRSGAIYALDLKKDDTLCVNLITQKLLQKIGAFHPLGIDLFVDESQRKRMAVVNNVEGDCRIEIFELQGRTIDNIRLEHVCTLGPHELLTHPNSVAICAWNRFYVTNPRNPRTLLNPWRYFDDMRCLRSGRILHCGFTDDGSAEWTIADEGLSYPNGIVIDRKAGQPRIYVALMKGRQIRVYVPTDNGQIKRSGEPIDLFAVPDNLRLDPDGDLWVGANPSFMKAIFYFMNLRDTSPSAVLRVSQPQSEKPIVETVFFDSGELISGSSVGCPYADDNRFKLVVGSVADKLLIVDLR
jgi:arylesterase / paraoxonase